MDNNEAIDMNELNNYLNAFLPESKAYFAGMEKYALDNNIPIMDKQSMHFLKQLIRIKQPNYILELGTAIGYSALQMLDAYPQATIITIERDEARYKEALQYIQQHNKQERIQVLHGEAIQLLGAAHIRSKTFDFVFIDAAKGQYKNFFELIHPLVLKNGIIATDNVLFKGHVMNSNEAKSNRHKKLAEKINQYNEWLNKHPAYMTTFHPLGDGVSISVKI